MVTDTYILATVELEVGGPWSEANQGKKMEILHEKQTEVNRTGDMV
jgi:hypothetical protein